MHWATAELVYADLDLARAKALLCLQKSVIMGEEKKKNIEGNFEML